MSRTKLFTTISWISFILILCQIYLSFSLANFSGTYLPIIVERSSGSLHAVVMSSVILWIVYIWASLYRSIKIISILTIISFFELYTSLNSFTNDFSVVYIGLQILLLLASLSLLVFTYQAQQKSPYIDSPNKIVLLLNKKYEKCSHFKTLITTVGTLLFIANLWSCLQLSNLPNSLPLSEWFRIFTYAFLFSIAIIIAGLSNYKSFLSLLLFALPINLYLSLVSIGVIKIFNNSVTMSSLLIGIVYLVIAVLPIYIANWKTIKTDY
jgi:hypothetical protein